MDAKNAGISPALVETIAGLSAGTIATLIVHPLDIVKTRMQIHRSTGSTGPSPTTVAILRSLLASHPNPLTALYRGLTPNLLGNASSWASFFFLKSRAERAILTLKPILPTTHHDAHAHPSARLTPTDYFLASGLAGIGTQALTNPIWVLKTRMLSSDRGTAGAYPSMWAGVRRLMREEGVRGFYRGLGVSFLGVSHGAVQFAVYEPAKRVYFRRRRRKGGAEGSEGKEGRIGNEATIVISTVSKLAAGAVTYPYQVVRSRLQNYNAEERFGRGIVGVSQRLWREEGLRGFYRGLVPGVVRVLPATWVTFLVYENVKYYLPLWAA